MKKALSAAAVMTAALWLPTAALAQGGNLSVPAGDALAQTPPTDVKGKQVRSSPDGEVSPKKLRELNEDGSTAHTVTTPQP